jgi:predicted RNase H-like HicB family nuclease
MEKYVVVIEKGERNYSAYSPDVLGCVATAITVEETLLQMKSALAFHLNGLLADGDDLPRSKGLSYHLSQSESIADGEDIITHIFVELPETSFA